MAETSGTLGVTACLYSEAGVFLSWGRAGVAAERTGLPGDGKATFFLLLRAATVTSSSRTTGDSSSL